MGLGLWDQIQLVPVVFGTLAFVFQHAFSFACYVILLFFHVRVWGWLVVSIRVRCFTVASMFGFVGIGAAHICGWFCFHACLR